MSERCETCGFWRPEGHSDGRGGCALFDSGHSVTFHVDGYGETLAAGGGLTLVTEPKSEHCAGWKAKAVKA